MQNQIGNRFCVLEMMMVGRSVDDDGRNSLTTQAHNKNSVEISHKIFSHGIALSEKNIINSCLYRSTKQAIQTEIRSKVKQKKKPELSMKLYFFAGICNSYIFLSSNFRFKVHRIHFTVFFYTSHFFFQNFLKNCLKKLFFSKCL